MIMGSFDRIATVSARDHENGSPDSETSEPTTEWVWQTVTVTSGRIIIGWRVGTQGSSPSAGEKTSARRRADLSRTREGSFCLSKRAGLRTKPENQETFRCWTTPF